MLTRISLALLLSFAAPLHAQTLDEQDRATIAQISTDFDTAFADGDIPAVIDAVPPAMFEYIADTNGMDVETLRNLLITQTEQMMDTVEINEFEMDVDSLEPGVTSSGRDYALVPTRTVLTVPDTGTLELTSQTLFLDDNGTWYLVRIDDPNQVAVLTEVYPDFAGIEFAQGTITPIQ